MGFFEDPVSIAETIPLLFILALWALPVATLMVVSEDYRRKRKRILFNSGNALKCGILGFVCAPFVGCGAITLTASFTRSTDTWDDTISYSLPVMLAFLIFVFYFTHARQQESQ